MIRRLDPLVLFIILLILVAAVIAGIIVMTHRELKDKPVLTRFMVSKLPWPKQKAAE